MPSNSLGKRIIASFLSLAIAWALVPSLPLLAYAEDTSSAVICGEAGYDTLKAASEALQESEESELTLCLTQDLEVAETETISVPQGKIWTIDMAGHSVISGAVGGKNSPWVLPIIKLEGAGTLRIIDSNNESSNASDATSMISDMKNPDIVTLGATKYTSAFSADNATVVNAGSGTLVADGVIIRGAWRCVKNAGTGACVIENTHVVAASKVTTALEANKNQFSVVEGSNINLTNSIVEADIRKAMGSTSTRMLLVGAGQNVFVTGGTFAFKNANVSAAGGIPTYPNGAVFDANIERYINPGNSNAGSTNCAIGNYTQKVDATDITLSGTITFDLCPVFYKDGSGAEKEYQAQFSSWSESVKRVIDDLGNTTYFSPQPLQPLKLGADFKAIDASGNDLTIQYSTGMDSRNRCIFEPAEGADFNKMYGASLNDFVRDSAGTYTPELRADGKIYWDGHATMQALYGSIVANTGSGSYKTTKVSFAAPGSVQSVLPGSSSNSSQSGLQYIYPDADTNKVHVTVPSSAPSVEDAYGAHLEPTGNWYVMASDENINLSSSSAGSVAVAVTDEGSIGNQAVKDLAIEDGKTYASVEVDTISGAEYFYLVKAGESVDIECGGPCAFMWPQYKLTNYPYAIKYDLGGIEDTSDSTQGNTAEFTVPWSSESNPCTITATKTVKGDAANSTWTLDSPEHEGYEFLYWYYKDANGNEVRIYPDNSTWVEPSSGVNSAWASLDETGNLQTSLGGVHAFGGQSVKVKYTDADGNEQEARVTPPAIADSIYNNNELNTADDPYTYAKSQAGEPAIVVYAKWHKDISLDLSSATIEGGTAAYDGEIHPATFTAKDASGADVELVEGVDYTVTSVKNADGEEMLGENGQTQRAAGDYTVSIAGTGSEGSGVYGTATFTFTISDEHAGKDTQTVTLAGGIETSLVYGSTEPFSLGAANDRADGGALSYASSDNAVATVDESGTVTITGDGTATITVTAAATDKYKPAKTAVELTVAKGTQTLTGTSYLTAMIGEGASATIDVASDISGAVLSYKADSPFVTVSADGVADLSKIQGDATVTVTVTSKVAGYEDATFAVKISVAGKQVIVGTALNTIAYGEELTLDAKSNLGEAAGKLTYRSANPEIATVDEIGKVTTVGLGRTTITVIAPAVGDYKEARFYTDVKVTAGEQKLTGAAEFEKAYGDEPFKLDAASNASDATLAYAVVEDSLEDGDVVTVSEDGTVTICNAGSATIKVSSPATELYGAAEDMTVKVTVARATQELTGTESYRLVYDADATDPQVLELDVASSAGDEVEWYYESDDEDVVACTDEDGLGPKFELKGIGAATITAEATGTNYEKATFKVTVTVIDAAIKAVDEKIAAIDASNPDASAVEAARAAYDALSKDQQALVLDADALTAAEKVLADKAAAKAFDEQVAAIDASNPDASAVEAARAAYDALSDEAKALVSDSLKALQAAEKVLADKAAAKAFDEQVAAIDASNPDASAVKAARAAYDALSDEAKALVSDSLKALQAAEKVLADKAAELRAGQSVTVGNYVYTVVNAKSKTVSVKLSTKGKKSLKNAKIASTVKLNGKTYKVVAVAAKGFASAKKLVKVTGGANLTSIGKQAFKGCKKLKTVKLTGKKLAKIGAQAFKSCNKLKTLSIAKTTKLTKKGVKKSLKGSSVKTVKVAKSMKKKCKKFFTKANCGKKVTVK